MGEYPAAFIVVVSRSRLSTAEPCFATFDERLQSLATILGLEQFCHVRLEPRERRVLAF
jgi:hypothetical protein